MINIAVYSQSGVDIETKHYEITNQAEMINFIKALIDKAYYSGERLCLETADVDSNRGLVNFKEVERW